MPFVDPEGFSGGLWPHGYRAAGARYPGSVHPGTRPAAQPAEPKWLRCWARCPSAPGPRVRTPHEILLCNNGQEEIRTAEILTPADFIGHQSRSILRSQMGCGTDPGGLEWRGHGRSAVGLEGFDGRSEPTIPEFYRKGVFIPTAHGGPKGNFTLISLKVKVFSSTIGSQWSVGVCL